MKTLNELAIEYKATKNREALNQIFIILQKTVKEKAKHTFYQRKFVKRMVDVEVPNEEGTAQISKRLPECFKLVDTHLVELEDVEQELNLDILRLIDRYDTSRPFDKYLFSSLWNWTPNFINRNFISQLDNISLSPSDGDEEGSINGELIESLKTFPKFDEELDVRDMFANLTETEEKLLNILKNNSDLKQFQLAGIMKVSRQRINELFQSIRQKFI